MKILLESREEIGVSLTVRVLLLSKDEERKHDDEEHLEGAQQLASHGTLLDSHGEK